MTFCSNRFQISYCEVIRHHSLSVDNRAQLDALESPHSDSVSSSINPNVSAVQRGRADAQSASECMAGLRAACADKLTILEDRLAAAMEAITKVQALEHRHHWASGVAHSLLSAPVLPKYPNPFRR